jgi:hypothetical protein
MSGDLDPELFKVITHLISSAPVSLEETPILAAFRMVDAAHRLMALAAASEAFTDDAFLSEAQSDYLAHFNLVMTDQVAFEAWLADYVRKFTVEARDRTRAAASAAPTQVDTSAAETRSA